MKKIFFFAAAAAMMAACSENDQLALNQEIQSQQDKGIQFSVYTNRAVTRAGMAGILDTEALKKDSAGIGVFAFHTNNSKYDERTSLPNFMYNQHVKFTDNGWTYEPVKYWPNEFGANALSEDIDYVTFFAYAPYVAVDPTTGIPKVDLSEFDKEGSSFADDFAKYLGYNEGITEFKETEKYQSDADAKEALKMLYAKQQQGKNVTALTRNADKGDPIVRYVVDTNPQTSVDLLWGVAAENNGFAGLADPTATITAGNCYLDLSKQIGVSDSIKWRFYHALAKLNVQIIAAADVATQGTTAYAPETNAGNLPEATKIYLRSIDFTGFAMRGALNLHSEQVTADYKLKPNWMNYDGTDLTAGTVTFYDGLKDGKEGYTDNIATGEKPLGLNPVLIEEPTTKKWADKQQGIPTQQYANLFAGAKKADDAIFVIPTNERMAITVIYDIMTRDSLLSQNLSDGFTKGSRVNNKISQTLEGLKLEAGKAYTIKLVVGIESVKVTVDVEEWYDYEGGEQKVDLPYNPVSANTSAVVNGVEYETIQAAIAAAQDGETIVIEKDFNGDGIQIPEGKYTNGIVIDFNGHTFTHDGALVGSTGTERQVMQLLKDNKITLKNGTIKSNKARMIIQNYSDLTLDNMTLEIIEGNQFPDKTPYTLSNNCGNITINNSTIKASPRDGAIAFDVCRYADYPSVFVTVKGNSQINGDIEIDAKNSDAKDGFGLDLQSGTVSGGLIITDGAAAAMASTPAKASIQKASTVTLAAPTGFAWDADGKLVAE